MNKEYVRRLINDSIQASEDRILIKLIERVEARIDLFLNAKNVDGTDLKLYPFEARILGICDGYIGDALDKAFAKIYRCPHCGLLCEMNTVHSCNPILERPPKKDPLESYIIRVLLKEAPSSDMVEFAPDSPYTATGITNAVMAAGYPGKASSVASNLGEMFIKGTINRRPASLTYRSTSKGGKPITKRKATYIYWQKEAA